MTDQERETSLSNLSSADLRTGASAPASLGLERRSRCWNCGAWLTSGEAFPVDGIDVLLAAYCSNCVVDVERGRWALADPADDPRPTHLRFRPVRFLVRNRDRILAALERRTDLIDPQEDQQQ